MLINYKGIYRFKQIWNMYKKINKKDIFMQLSINYKLMDMVKE